VRAAAAFADEVRTRSGERRPAVLLDVDVLLASENAVAAVDLARLDEWSGSEYRSNSVLHHGDPESLVNLLTELRGIDGVVLRPLALASTLELLTTRVIPALRPSPRPATTVRDLLGLTRPRSRYATTH
jgi:hypothetical protein